MSFSELKNGHKYDVCWDLESFFANDELCCFTEIDCKICRIFKYYEIYKEKFRHFKTLVEGSELSFDKNLSLKVFYRRCLCRVLTDFHMLFIRSVIICKNGIVEDIINNNVLYNPMSDE